MTPRDEELGDYWCVYLIPDGHLMVSAEEGRSIEKLLTTPPAEVWISFTTLYGAHVTYRVANIAGVCETTTAQRDRAREIDEMIKAEDKAAQPSGWTPDRD
jgi:hypothetical protein